MAQLHVHKPEYHSFLLRMWRDTEGSAWRLQLENPFTGEKMGFPSLVNLFTYLNSQTTTTPEDFCAPGPAKLDSDPA